ncbi:MAG TPA: LysR family transcriptional regulator [Polyangiaceae bacterium]
MVAGCIEARDLRLVQAIAEAGGATQAGKRLHLSQSAVSHQLRGLEERLGVQLFRREGRRLRITSAGERLVQVARQVLKPLLEAELELRRGTDRQRPKLRVATQCYTAYHWLPQALKALMTEHPEVELALQSDVVTDAAEYLKDDRGDVVLCVAPPSKGAFTTLPLFRDELVLAIPRGHPLASRKYVEGSDLAEETLIQGNASSAERERVKSVLFGSGGGVKHVVRLPVTEAVIDLVEAGMGVSILPGFTLRARLQRGDLEVVRLTRRGFHRSWTGVFRGASPLEAPIRTLLGTLKRYGLPALRAESRK